MKTGYQVNGADALVRRLKAFPQEVGRAKQSILVQEARALCVAYGAKSEPYGMGEGSGDKFRGTVEGDVRRVFVTPEQGGRLVKILMRRSVALGKGLARVIRENPAGWMRDPQARRYLAEGGIQLGKLDATVHKAARTGRKGRVPKNYEATEVVSEAQLRAFANAQKKLVGLAKAGWYCAARALGGRVRSNKTDAVTGKRTTAEIFPGYVRKIARKYPDLGGARVEEGRVEVFTSVRHGDEALTIANQTAAESEAKASLAASLLKAVQEIRGRVFGRAA